MKTSDFWGHFEEIALEESLESSEAYGTQTRQREEPDQRNACILAGSKTITNTREESDQDYGNNQFYAIPKQNTWGTMTQTFTIEESDQDEGNEQYCAIPMQSPSWKTMTKTREEPDQDKSSCRYATIPTQFLCEAGTLTEQREEADQDETNRAYGVFPIEPRVQI